MTIFTAEIVCRLTSYILGTDLYISFTEVLEKVREFLQEQGYEQIPQFSSMNPMDVSHKFDLVPDTNRGAKRAVMIGINYVGKLFAALDVIGRS